MAVLGLFAFIFGMMLFPKRTVAACVAAMIYTALTTSACGPCPVVPTDAQAIPDSASEASMDALADDIPGDVPPALQPACEPPPCSADGSKACPHCYECLLPYMGAPSGYCRINPLLPSCQGTPAICGNDPCALAGSQSGDPCPSGAVPGTCLPVTTNITACFACGQSGEDPCPGT